MSKGFKKVKSFKGNNIYDSKVECPSCNSKDTFVNDGASIVIMFGLFATIACIIGFSTLAWVPVIGWGLMIPIGIGIFLGIGIIILGVIMLIFTKKYTFHCRSCGSKYKIAIQEYKRLAFKSMMKKPIDDIETKI